MPHDNDRTEDFYSGIGPNGPDEPKVFTGAEIPTFIANEGSRYFSTNGTFWKYKVPPEVPLATWVKESLSDITEAEAFTSEAEDQTASDLWVSKTGFPFLTEGVKTAGQFSVRWSIEVGQTKANKTFSFRVRWRAEGGTWVDLTSLSTTISTPGDTYLQGGFKEVVLPSADKIELDVQHGVTTATGNSILRNVSVEVRRIGD